MPPKRKQLQSTTSHMDPHEASLDSLDDDYFAYDETEERQPESLADVENPRVGFTKRQYWTVQLRNSEGQVKECPIKINDVWLLPVGEKVIICFDGFQPSGTEVDGLLGGFLGRLAQDHKNFPISFRKWPMVPSHYKEFVWSSIIKTRFWWDPIHEETAKSYMMKDIGKKWRNHRGRLFEKYYDSTKTREENIRVPPLTIPAVEWASFIDYRLEEGTKAKETGQEPSRGLIFIDTHKRHDGNYISEEARVVCEKIVEIDNQRVAPVAISPNDSLGQVFGKEHPGRVCGVGSGVCPSQLFGSNYHFSGTPLTFNTNGQTVQNLQNEIHDLKTEMKEVLTQLLTKNAMPIPSHLAHGPTQTPGDPSHSGNIQ